MCCCLVLVTAPLCRESYFIPLLVNIYCAGISQKPWIFHGDLAIYTDIYLKQQSAKNSPQSHYFHHPFYALVAWLRLLVCKRRWVFLAHHITYPCRASMTDPPASFSGGPCQHNNAVLPAYIWFHNDKTAHMCGKTTTVLKRTRGFHLNMQAGVSLWIFAISPGVIKNFGEERII